MKHKVSDSLRNLVSGLGTDRDKAVYSEFTRPVLTQDYLGTLYRHWIFAKAVDIPADDMVSKGRTCYGDNVDAQQLEDFYRQETALDIGRHLSDALKWSRLYGGSIILMDLRDSGQSLDQPVDFNRLGKGCIVSLEVLDSTEVFPEHEVEGFTNSRKPIWYRLADGTLVHPDRIIRFDGIRLPWKELQRNRYWGDSILPRIYDDALAAKTTLQSISSMVFESNIDVVKVKNLFPELNKLFCVHQN